MDGAAIDATGANGFLGKYFADTAMQTFTDSGGVVYSPFSLTGWLDGFSAG